MDADLEGYHTSAKGEEAPAASAPVDAVSAGQPKAA
jgi:hypothetical protein